MFVGVLRDSQLPTDTENINAHTQIASTGSSAAKDVHLRRRPSHRDRPERSFVGDQRDHERWLPKRKQDSLDRESIYQTIRIERDDDGDNNILRGDRGDLVGGG